MNPSYVANGYAVQAPTPSVRVTVTDLDVPFIQLVWLLIKIAFASIPAMIIVSLVMGCVGLLFTALGIALVASL